MSKDSSAKYYQNNKERLQKKVCERYPSFSKEEKEKKNDNTVLKDTKSTRRRKTKTCLV